jgi:hypothetical protein
MERAFKPASGTCFSLFVEVPILPNSAHAVSISIRKYPGASGGQSLVSTLKRRTEPPGVATRGHAEPESACATYGTKCVEFQFANAQVDVALASACCVETINNSRLEFIIQGQTNCVLSAHRKPQSLDFWLRQNFADNPDTKQAVNEVINQLVSTGCFEEGQFLCPDSGRLCKGVRLVVVRSLRVDPVESRHSICPPTKLIVRSSPS